MKLQTIFQTKEGRTLSPIFHQKLGFLEQFVGLIESPCKQKLKCNFKIFCTQLYTHRTENISDVLRDTAPLFIHC